MRSTAPRNMLVPVIDPTVNVRELVAANERYRDAMRTADARLNEEIRKRDFTLHQAMLAAEVRRITDLATQREKNVDSNLVAVLAQVATLNRFMFETGGKGTGRGEIVAYVITAISVLVTIGIAFLKPH
jgi:hypothetical protein